jgi:hypothetical protein
MQREEKVRKMKIRKVSREGERKKEKEREVSLEILKADRKNLEKCSGQKMPDSS